jgi:hypothetical protein
VRGTEIEMMDLNTMRSKVAEAKEDIDKVAANALVPHVEVIDSQCGVTLGGKPGGGDGFGGNQRFAGGM